MTRVVSALQVVGVWPCGAHEHGIEVTWAQAGREHVGLAGTGQFGEREALAAVTDASAHRGALH